MSLFKVYLKLMFMSECCPQIVLIRNMKVNFLTFRKGYIKGVDISALIEQTKKGVFSHIDSLEMDE